MLNRFKLFYYRHVFALVIALGAAGCASAGSPALPVQPLTPAQVQQDLANFNYFAKAAGCAVATEGAAASPIVSLAADATGNQVLQAVDATGAVICNLTLPPTALPAPVPASAPPVTLPPSAAVPISMNEWRPNGNEYRPIV